MIDVNRVTITGTIAEPRLGYLESGKPDSNGRTRDSGIVFVRSAT